jgi:hypothetical protein
MNYGFPLKSVKDGLFAIRVKNDHHQELESAFLVYTSRAMLLFLKYQNLYIPNISLVWLSSFVD